MNTKFDELTRNMAQSVTRRQALRKFGVGLVGMALACFGLTNKAEADPKPTDTCLPIGAQCKDGNDCCSRKCNRPKWGSFYPYPACGV